jgi:Uma2 family endonuclease
MALPSSVRYTYDDYVLLPEDRRYEILDGDLFMTPAPTPYHQLVSKRIEFLLDDHVRRNQLGEVLDAPCDVVLSASDIVQPDILFIVADRLSIIGEKFITAAPDVVVEVLSPSTADRDQTLKTKLYARFGVRELWIASPEAKTIEVLVLSGQTFRREALYGRGDVLRTPLLPGLEIPLDQVF